jgi:hypothetical protein
MMEEHKSDWDELWESADVENKKHYEVFTQQSSPEDYTPPAGKKYRIFVDELDAILFNPLLT